MRMTTRGKQQDLEYLAGMIDADGCIAIRKTKAVPGNTKNDQYELSLNVTNTSEHLMSWLTERFGGKIYNRHHKEKNWKPTYDWRLMNKHAANLLKELKDRLVVKKAQAEIGIELEDNRVRNNHGTTPEELSRRIRLYDQIRALNQTGLACSLND